MMNLHRALLHKRAPFPHRSLPLLAIGKKSENTLLDAGFSVKGLRHPANGGANIFRNQLADFFRK